MVWTDVGWAIEALPVVEPVHRAISPIEFIGLCRQAGGMSPAQAVASKADQNLAFMWMMFDMTDVLHIDNIDVQAGIAALDALGYLPNGAEAVIAA